MRRTLPAAALATARLDRLRRNRTYYPAFYPFSIYRSLELRPTFEGDSPSLRLLTYFVLCSSDISMVEFALSRIPVDRSISPARLTSDVARPWPRVDGLRRNFRGPQEKPYPPAGSRSKSGTTVNADTATPSPEHTTPPAAPSTPPPQPRPTRPRRGRHHRTPPQPRHGEKPHPQNAG